MMSNNEITSEINRSGKIVSEIAEPLTEITKTLYTQPTYVLNLLKQQTETGNTIGHVLWMFPDHKQKVQLYLEILTGLLNRNVPPEEILECLTIKNGGECTMGYTVSECLMLLPSQYIPFLNYLLEKTSAGNNACADIASKILPMLPSAIAKDPNVFGNNITSRNQLIRLLTLLHQHLNQNNDLTSLIEELYVRYKSYKILDLSLVVLALRTDAIPNDNSLKALTTRKEEILNYIEQNLPFKERSAIVKKGWEDTNSFMYQLFHMQRGIRALDQNRTGTALYRLAQLHTRLCTQDSPMENNNNEAWDGDDDYQSNPNNISMQLLVSKNLWNSQNEETKGQYNRGPAALDVDYPKKNIVEMSL